MTPARGFTLPDYPGKRFVFIDPHGKDISFERWRVCLYYAPHYAVTHFLPDELASQRFLADYAGQCYDAEGYQTWSQSEQGRRLDGKLDRAAYAH